MNKSLLVVALLLAVVAFVSADNQLNATQLGHDASSALNKTADKAIAIKEKMKDFFLVNDDDTTVEKVFKYIFVVCVGLAGLETGFAGYRSILNARSYAGFGLGGMFFCALVSTISPDSTAASRVAFWAGALITSLVCYYVHKVGIALLAGAGGMALAFQFAAAFHTGHGITLLLIILLAIVAGLLVLYDERTTVIQTSANFGAFLISLVVGFFVGHVPHGVTYDSMSSDDKRYAAYYIIGWGVLSVIMYVVQVYYTAVGIDHSTKTDGDSAATDADAKKTKPKTDKPVHVV
ncbi:hypothetical protein AC1031_000971 [Aphanomyces cochlioides]|nr:hypothetical protein AC1031_000971 [Aphanomyces cochlioides]